jgi:hypothetical protein
VHPRLSVVKFPAQVNPQSSSLASRYFGAVVVAFFSSIVSWFLLFSLAIRCEPLGAFVTGAAYFAMIAIVGFAGVFAGTLFLPKPARRTGSKRLLFSGLAFSFLLFAVMDFSPFTSLLPLILHTPLAAGGFAAVLIFIIVDKEASAVAKTRNLAIVLSAGICLMLSFGILFAWVSRPNLMTKEKALKLFERAGGIDKVEQEANVLFDRFGTNEYWLMRQSDSTNFPAISALGNSVSLDANQPITIRFGGRFHTKSIYIFPSNLDLSKIPATSLAYYTNASRCIRITNNIFVKK